MTKPQRYRLKLTKLDFVSLVDTPAQPNATTLLIKCASKGDEVEATARFVKVSDELGLAFFWAFTSTNADGSDHFDLQGDNVDQDFLKAAMEFMVDGGGAVDEMHDGKQTARVVFAFPMTPDIAKAFGVVSKTSGLMVAVKPTKDQLAKLKTGELNGVSIAGAGLREAVKRAPATPAFKRLRATLLAKLAPARVRKEVVLTDLVDGHQHGLDLDDPAGWCGDKLTTSAATAEGADYAHAHVWTFDATSGAVTIAADSGHTHTVDGVVPPEVLAVFALNERAEDAEQATAVLERVLDGDAPAGNVSVSVAARAPQKNSTPAEPNRKVGSQPENAKMNFAKMLAIVLAMTPTQQAHVAKLAPDEAEAFVGKPANERDSIVKAALDADPIVYKTTSGIEIRKSAGELAVEMAKQADASAKAAAEATALVQKRDVELEQEKLEKRAATEVPYLKGTVKQRAKLLKMIAAEPDEVERNALLEIVKGASAVYKQLGENVGGSTGDDATPTDTKSTYAALAKGLTAFAKTNKIEKVWTEGLDAFVQTPEGAALKEAYDVAKQAEKAA